LALGALGALVGPVLDDDSAPEPEPEPWSEPEPEPEPELPLSAEAGAAPVSVEPALAAAFVWALAPRSFFAQPLPL